MCVAVVGSRGLHVPDLSSYIPKGTTVIVSGGAKGVDASARAYAEKHGIELIEFLPEYRKYGRAAPLRRNIEIIEYADCVLAFWDGESHGTAFVIQKCKEVECDLSRNNLSSLVECQNQKKHGRACNLRDCACTWSFIFSYQSH